MKVKATHVHRDREIIVERHIHALVHLSQPIRPQITHSEERDRVAYLVIFHLSVIIHHLEGNVGPVLNARDSRLGGLDADASTRTRSLKIIDDELICAGGGVEVVKGRRGGRGGDRHSDWGKIAKRAWSELSWRLRRRWRGATYSSIGGVYLPRL